MLVTQIHVNVKYIWGGRNTETEEGGWGWGSEKGRLMSRSELGSGPGPLWPLLQALTCMSSAPGKHHTS